ncbi:MAG: cation:proton antiporter regulatory subunit [Euryarchaeota archaeon]|nr:cation:proton antiporter regulatory subunit [Euryarchaeota archaeon]
MADITENELPGIGKRFSLDTVEGGTVTVIAHLSGRRDVYYSTGEDRSPTFFTLTDEEARRLSAVLGDTFYKPAPMEMLRSALSASGGIELLHIAEGSPVVGRTLRELDVRRKTGATVVGIKRGEDTLTNPPASATLQRNDYLIVMGGSAQLRRLDRMIRGT